MSKLTNKIKIAIREAEEPRGEKQSDSTQQAQFNGPQDITPSEVRADNAQYDKIQGLLGDTIFNHAAIIERLWGNSDATNRSEFGKRLKKEKIDGSVHVFTDKEIGAIASILQSAATAISKDLGAPETDERGLEDNYGHKR